ncbi:beta-galactosidase [Streptomyces scopuliridis]|uniref:beta-galactosidase n=1 Tax=Streptomyces scopuliridis TaxID=452529 RepID=UPI0036CD2336
MDMGALDQGDPAVPAADEVAPEVCDFSGLDETMTPLHGASIAVGLATPTAAPPLWFSRVRCDAARRAPKPPHGVCVAHGRF